MMAMQEFIAKIGKGPKAAKDLTWDEAKQAMKALIEGDATPAQVGAFLLAMRIKMESVTELAAFTATARSYVAPVPVPRELGVVDIPTYAGKQETFHALAGAAIVAAAAGASILMHGYDGVPGDLGQLGSSRDWVFLLILSRNALETRSRRRGLPISTLGSITRQSIGTWKCGESLACGISFIQWHDC
jgi:hypothetical protein